MVDWTKPIQTVDGVPCELLTTKGRGSYPVLVYHGTEAVPRSYRINGRYLGDWEDSEYDIINVTSWRTLWLCVYESGGVDAYNTPLHEGFLRDPKRSVFRIEIVGDVVTGKRVK